MAGKQGSQQGKSSPGRKSASPGGKSQGKETEKSSSTKSASK